MLKENAERETQYQQMINHLSTNVVEGIADINNKLDDMARKMEWVVFMLPLISPAGGQGVCGQTPEGRQPESAGAAKRP